jgi:hypothetical protein
MEKSVGSYVSIQQQQNYEIHRFEDYIDSSCEYKEEQQGIPSRGQVDPQQTHVI